MLLGNVVVVGIVSIVSLHQVLLWDRCTAQAFSRGNSATPRPSPGLFPSGWVTLIPGVEKNDALRENEQKLKSVR